ncbi:hypothetical protein OX90_26285 [Pseudomonas coronafaciens pv. porri]|uniref:PIN domain-containing protein n=1 Tax=Pseudomonas coronafaciens pv. porri TaxID=83964 RepID=A0ABR5JGF2_9PSED|nr:hypothetical protein [Pseudomonas coronafaciens]KOP51707.1 hypothetical protein OX90_26285 [Pseudomonas coronafaciens pv. porri]
MSTLYVLDTNAYALLFQSPRPEAYANLENILLKDGVMSFYIPEIVSMEIHSVLGKFRRSGNKAQNELCSRQVMDAENVIPCAHTCFIPAKPRIKPRVFKDMQKLLNDIEREHGSIRASLLPLGSNEMRAGREILSQLAHKFSFGSHDALVAGTVLTAKNNGLALTLVTSDKSLKAVCKDQNIPHYDPSKPDTAQTPLP